MRPQRLATGIAILALVASWLGACDSASDGGPYCDVVQAADVLVDDAWSGDPDAVDVAKDAWLDDATAPPVDATPDVGEADVMEDVSTGDVPGDATASDASEADTQADVLTGPVTLPNRAGDWTYLVITNDEMAPAYERLVEWREATGLPGHVVLVEDILARGGEGDEAAQLRDFIRLAVQEHATEIVLLGGDTPFVPHRSVYVHAVIGSSLSPIYETEAVTATELYFSDLDGDWDADGDGELARPADQLDMRPDVAVGRVPSRTLDEAEAYVDKVLAYEAPVDDDYQMRVMLIGEPTGWGDIHGSWTLENWANTEFRHWDVLRLYSDWEDFPNAYENTRSAQVEAHEDGYGWIVQNGHGNWNTLSYLDLGDVWNLKTAPRFSIMLATACYAGDFATDHDDHSAGEAYVLNPDGGGVAYVGNTDIGIGFPSGHFFLTDVSERLMDDAGPRMGVAFAEARMMNLASGTWTNLHSHRYTQFVVDLLGDPGLRVWRRAPRPVRLSHRGFVFPNEELDIRVTDVWDTPVAGVDITIRRPGELLLVGTTGPDGVLHLAGIDAAPGQVTLTASGADVVPTETSITIR